MIVEREAELDERESNAAAVTSTADDQPARGTYTRGNEGTENRSDCSPTDRAGANLTGLWNSVAGVKDREEEEAQGDNAVQTTITGQSAVETSGGKPGACVPDKSKPERRARGIIPVTGRESNGRGVT